MKHLKFFESNNIEDEIYTVLFMYGGLPESIYTFSDFESMKNSIINTIHSNSLDEEGEDYGCKDIFDLQDLLDYWNNRGNRRYEKGDEIYCDEIYYESTKINREKIQLLPDLQTRMDSKKYNL